jgi:hypothetical protein
LKEREKKVRKVKEKKSFCFDRIDRPKQLKERKKKVRKVKEKNETKTIRSHVAHREYFVYHELREKPRG